MCGFVVISGKVLWRNGSKDSVIDVVTDANVDMGRND